VKALIRNGEVYTEDRWSSFTRTHLAWMCGQEKDENGSLLPGNGWTLVDNYVPPTDTEAESYDVAETAEDPDTIVIDGVTYTRSS